MSFKLPLPPQPMPSPVLLKHQKRPTGIHVHLECNPVWFKAKVTCDVPGAVVTTSNDHKSVLIVAVSSKKPISMLKLDYPGLGMVEIPLDVEE